VFLRDGRVVHAADRPDALRAMYRDLMARVVTAADAPDLTSR